MKNKKPSDFDATHTENRRGTLKTLFSGAGLAVVGSQALPERWLKPVVSSIVMPAHAQTSAPAQLNFEAACAVGEVSLTRNIETDMKSFLAEVTAEADDGVLVDAIVRSPNDNEWTQDFVFTATFSGGVANFNDATFPSEAETTNIQVDFDIGQDDNIDCSDVVEVTIP